MSQHPRTVAVETWITWDGMPVRLPRGQVIDVTPGSALEQAIGRDRLVSPRGMPLPPPVEPVEPVEQANPVEPPEPAPAPVKARAAARKNSDAKDGAS